MPSNYQVFDRLDDLLPPAGLGFSRRSPAVTALAVPISLPPLAVMPPDTVETPEGFCFEM